MMLRSKLLIFGLSLAGLGIAGLMGMQIIFAHHPKGIAAVTATDPSPTAETAVLGATTVETSPSPGASASFVPSVVPAQLVSFSFPSSPSPSATTNNSSNSTSSNSDTQENSSSPTPSSSDVPHTTLEFFTGGTNVVVTTPGEGPKLGIPG